MKNSIQILFFVTLAAVACFITGGNAAAQGAYAPVNPSDITSLKLNHYFSADKKHHQPDFKWSFTSTEFTLQKGTGSIPSDLLAKLLAAGGTSEAISGKWRLENGELVLTDFKAAEKTASKEVRLSIYRTAPTVIRIGHGIQYVFEVTR
ncbi:MAG: hypothetical protein V4710_15930 [Verrucomicrobiota bacterium]